ncbi:MAG TPA: hypothetical protein VJX67_12795, partial [Blastocatellia bacterium]|nr:hypothetical protein [Blastocatellia bacterium]
PDFIPKEFSQDTARERLQAAGWIDPDKLDPLQRLIDNGVVREKTRGAFYRVRFELDPIAEFLSAAAWVEECGSNESLWADLFSRIDAQDGSRGSPKGFLQALLESCVSKEANWGLRDQAIADISRRLNLDPTDPATLAK